MTSLTAKSAAIALIAVCVSGFALRMAWASWAHTTPTFANDGGLYFYLARSLAHGDGYRGPFGAATAYLPPAYPTLLGAALKIGRESRFAGITLNATLGVLGIQSLYFFARSGLRRAPALLAAALFAGLPSQIISTAVFFPDALFIVLLYLALGVYVRSLRTAAHPLLGPTVGVALGFAILTQSQLLLFPVVLAVHAAFSGLRGRRLALTAGGILVGVTLVITPWFVRNAVQIHDPGPVSTNGGVAFWIGNHAGATGHIEPRDQLAITVLTTDLVQREHDLNRAGFRLGISYAFHHPAATFANSWKKLFWTFGDDEEWMELNEDHGAQPLVSAGVRDYWFTLSNAYYYAILTLGGLGLLLMWPSRSPSASVALLFAAYWVVFPVLFYGDPRFHTAILPVAIFFASYAIFALVQSPSRIASRRDATNVLN